MGMKIALAQINSTVGDFESNSARVLDFYQRAISQGADLVLFPELTLCGYPPRDLVSRADFINEELSCLTQLTTKIGDVPAILGTLEPQRDEEGKTVLCNASVMIQKGEVVCRRQKSLLPTYDVFDESRYFQPSTANHALSFREHTFGITICEDIWNDACVGSERKYERDPVGELCSQEVEFILNLSASPWQVGKEVEREEMLSRVARERGVWFFYCNLVGGNDELVFDGGSFVVDSKGDIVGRAKSFEEDLILVEINREPVHQRLPALEREASSMIFRALRLGLHDYLSKCGFSKAVLGLSGGIDSAVTAVIAVEALGPENVFGVALPSQFSSQGSLDDAARLAKNLGIRYEVLPIKGTFGAVQAQLSDVFAGLGEDVTEENMQARLRGVALMAISNKLGSLLLTTGNKSELAVGYCTLYGDMCGGLAVISDVPKTDVYRLARWINRREEVIPVSTIEKPPSAELRPDQKDQDSLPDYHVLDEILDRYVVRMQSSREIVQAGFDQATVDRILRLVDSNEYKRRQAAPGLKVTSKAFGMGRRIPVAQRFKP